MTTMTERFNNKQDRDDREMELRLAGRKHVGKRTDSVQRDGKWMMEYVVFYPTK